jgi:hypothetical protein
VDDPGAPRRFPAWTVLHSEISSVESLDVLNSNAEYLLCTHPRILNCDEHILQRLFCNRKQSRLSFQIDRQLATYFFHHDGARHGQVLLEA